MTAEPRATHPKLARALERIGAADLSLDCAAPAPAELLKGIREFNAGEFFEQHETIELLWRATPGEIRHLYEGILQIGVGMHHLLSRRNFHGAVVKLDHGIRLLDAFPSVCHGIDVLRLRTDAAAARAALLDLGPTRLSEFPPSLVPKVHLIDETVASDSGSASAGRDGADGNSVGGDRRLAGMHDETTA